MLNVSFTLVTLQDKTGAIVCSLLSKMNMNIYLRFYIIYRHLHIYLRMISPFKIILKLKMQDNFHAMKYLIVNNCFG